MKKVRHRLSTLQKNATQILEQNGKFLLVYDVINSRLFISKKGYQEMYDLLDQFHEEINKRFEASITNGEISCQRTFTGFEKIIGDSGGCFFTDVTVIEPITTFAKQFLPFSLRWAIGEDGWDKRIRI